jgi:uroporphyrinogen III methyltransferase/synthase
VGTRASNLALVQTRAALERIGRLLPAVRFETVPFSSPGDRDRRTDLRASPPDFFTRDLDDAVRAGVLDAAVHSAKDVPQPIPDGLDWFWLPWAEDPRDCLVLPPGHTLAGLPPCPRVGVSSDRREAYGRRRFPSAALRPIRGNIEDRLRQLDAGGFDLLIMAAAALLRLGLGHRITEWIPTADLPPPEGQGHLAIVFRRGDARFERLRSLFVRSVTFAGAGAGDVGLCTLAAREALERCDVCLYDALLDDRLLVHVPPRALRLDVGKRAGNHKVPQETVSDWLALYARRGLRVVRLKGGDPGLFGRLAEEVEALEALHLPYRVIPGVSSLLAATTGAGMLLTRRGVSRGFCALTPRARDGERAPIGRDSRAALPLVLFMASGVCREVMDELMRDGTAPEVPAAAVFNAGASDERIVDATVGTLAERVEAAREDAPGLLVVGSVAAFRAQRNAGALQGWRVLLTCSEPLVGRAAAAVWDLGGIPVPLPLVRLEGMAEAEPVLRRAHEYDWIVLASPSAVRCFLTGLAAASVDLRRRPRLAVCGAGTARELRQAGLVPDCEPTDGFGTEGLLTALRARAPAGARILRCRSDASGPELSEGLRATGFQVEDLVLYRNVSLRHASLPPCEAIVLASGSAVDSLAGQWGMDAVVGKTVVAIGSPTAHALGRHGRQPDGVAREATVESCVETLAALVVNRALEEVL